MKSRWIIPILLIGFLLPAAGRAEDREPAEAAPSFHREVMAVLSRSGCNQGGCHGNQNGKGGFLLSLRGQDPQSDYRSIVEEYAGRRIDRFHPEASLLLAKPLGDVAHQGGKRFGRDDEEYDILRRWIASGAALDTESEPVLVELAVEPTDAVINLGESIDLTAVARFDDGSSRAVNNLAVFEPTTNSVSVSDLGTATSQSFGESTVIARYLNQQVPVEIAVVDPAAPEITLDSATWDVHPVDRHVAAKLRRLKTEPSELAADTPFVRRLYLDLLGRLPTADEARTFVLDTSKDKRERLIDRLLNSPEFAQAWALKWSDLLRNEERTLDQRGVTEFHNWIVEAIERSMPVDQFVRELVAARGSTYDNPTSNYYRALRDPLTRGEATARLFLGVRLQCAKCHNHPFERWTQDDYYSWASVFATIDYEIVENKRRDKYDKHEFVGEQFVKILPAGAVTNARTGQSAAPRFLGADGDVSEDEVDRLEQLANWLTSPANRRFAEVQVNWVWYHMFGVGIIDPVDDFRITNRPANSDLLGELTQRFVDSGYDLKKLVRLIASSRTYQLASQPSDSNADDQRNFSRAIVRRLPAELLLDAQNQVLGTRSSFANYPDVDRAVGLPGARVRKPSEGDRFLRKFGKPTRLLGCECERSNETTLSHAFYLIGGDSLNDRLSRDDNRLAQMLASDMTREAMVQELFWSSLSRSPTDAEQRAALQLLESTASPAEALQDITWSLLNSKEFMFRH